MDVFEKCVKVNEQVREVYDSGNYFFFRKLESAQESLLVVKTRASRLPGIISLVKHRHSYSVPEIIALPIVGGNPDYLEWIEKEVK